MWIFRVLHRGVPDGYRPLQLAFGVLSVWWKTSASVSVLFRAVLPHLMSPRRAKAVTSKAWNQQCRARRVGGSSNDLVAETNKGKRRHRKKKYFFISYYSSFYRHICTLCYRLLFRLIPKWLGQCLWMAFGAFYGCSACGSSHMRFEEAQPNIHSWIVW